MRVAVLVSGGKDSTCNMLKCVRHGHDIVALANLHPRAGGGDELDSFMYQSVGHELIDAYAACMRVPLYRRAIRGSSRVTSMQYAPTDSADEVEDLFELLRDVQRHTPIDAVACGTILSSYQRIRVENVCQRLGLVCLAYLWQRDQATLLDEMLHDGIDAVLIKTACMGLGRAHIGRPLRELRDTLHTLAGRYGVHICGEGGEYESFTLDCPLFHQRIVLDDCVTVVHSDDPFAPVLYLSCRRFHLEDKPAATVRPCVGGSAASTALAFVRSREARPAVTAAVLASASSTLRESGSLMLVSGAHVAAAATSIADQVAAVFSHCFERLRGAEPLYVTLHLRDMSDYAACNAAYNQFFDANPPSRCAVALGAHGMPHSNALLSVDVVAASAAVAVSTLHVQSISEWAPACIGPYSQAKTIDESLLLLAGQIGLDPASMSLVDADAQFRVAEANCAAIVALLADCDAAAARERYQHVAVYHTLALPHAELHALAAQTFACPFTLIEVAALPRGALVELQVVAFRGSRSDARSVVLAIDGASALGGASLAVWAARDVAAHEVDAAQRHFEQRATAVSSVNGSASSIVALCLKV